MATPLLFHGPAARGAAIACGREMGRMVAEPIGDDGLKVDDRIVTSGGVYGRVARLEPDAIELEIAPKVKIRVARSQIISTQKTGSEDKKETK